ncbi:MAG TPA: TetR family transcriptional regulator [Acidimicrobiales bacterium]|nr:TetR family transcriptional regulator [Acidimicrobiales bacterium]
MPPDATDTKRRLLEAAYEEFSARGLAGARVDRIAAAAKANKQAIYAHFGTKDDLFDHVIDEHVQELLDAVPFTPEDLPGYAAATFEYLNEHPQLIRLTMWRYLERGLHFERRDERHAENTLQIAKAQREGKVTSTAAPADLLAIVSALATTWSLTGPTLLGQGPEPARSTEQRELIRKTVTRSVTAHETDQ